MYKIRRISIADVLSLCRCYGSQRNSPNHYETLCVQNNSTQKEIRDAFLKLSKKLHPDSGTKGSHSEFVKLNEAYKILSKDHSRRQHDMDLKYQSASAQNGQIRYSDRVYYHHPMDFKSQPHTNESEYSNDYYGIKGIKRVSNGTIAAICVVVVLIIVSLEMLALRRAVKKSQMYMNSRSLQAEQDYEEAKAIANSMTREEQVQAMQRKFDAQMARQIMERDSR